MVILVEEAQLALTMIGDRMKEDDRGERFEGFVLVVEPKLRRALIARYGRERGREATAEALAWAWQHWSRLEGVENPVAFLYRVGQTRSRQRQAPPIVDRVQTIRSSSLGWQRRSPPCPSASESPCSWSMVRNGLTPRSLICWVWGRRQCKHMSSGDEPAFDNS